MTSTNAPVPAPTTGAGPAAPPTNKPQPAGALGAKTRSSRAQRMSEPAAADVVREVAVSHRVCIRPVTLRVTDETTGTVEYVDVPCGATREDVCPVCAAKNKALRVAQCREGWHADVEPWQPRPPSDTERRLVEVRAAATAVRDSTADPDEAGDARALAAAADADLAGLGIRGSVEPGHHEPDPDTTGATATDHASHTGTDSEAGEDTGTGTGSTRGRRRRSTRRRQDTPDLPARPSNGSTLGRTYTARRDGRLYRPSMFLTLTLPSYGPVRSSTGTPVDPDTYDYTAAARGNLHFARLLDRFFQNLRRVAGYDVQYFTTIEPQKRGALHAHIAIRGTLPRTLIRQVITATYHQTWWPDTGDVVYSSDDPETLPRWVEPDEDTGTPGAYVDPNTGEVLPTWDQALDALDTRLDDDPDTDPHHLARFGTVHDIKGLLAGTPEADRRIGYLTKYLTKAIDSALGAATGQPVTGENDTGSDTENSEEGTEPVRRVPPEVGAHLDQLVEALRYEPCSPTCSNWLRYGIQPKNPKPRQRPGACRSKAHTRTHLGHAGRRVLVSRKWSGKTLADHKHDRAEFVRAVLLGDLDHTPTGHEAAADGPPRSGHSHDCDPNAPAGSRTMCATCARQHRANRSHRPGWSPGAPETHDSDGQPRRLTWAPASRGDPVPPLATRLLHAIAHSATWRQQYDQALQRAHQPTHQPAA